MRPFTIIDLKRMLEIAKLSIGLAEIAEARSSGGDGLLQHVSDDRNQSLNSGGCDASGGAGRVNARLIKRLADINITQPRDDSLVQQRRFDRHFPPFQGCDQIGAIEVIAQRLGAKFSDQRVAVFGRGRVQIHRAKASGVIERDAGTGLGLYDHVVMFGGGGMFVVKLAQSIAADQHPPRHSQMDKPCLSVIKIRQKVFRAAPEPQDLSPGQTLCHLVGQGPAQIGSIDLSAGDSGPFEYRGQPATDGLNFG